MTSPQTQPNLYGLIIGNDKYPNSKEWRDLEGAVKDANDIKKCLEKLGLWDAPKLKLMENAKRGEIISAFGSLKEGKFPFDKGQIPKDSIFVLFYAGHGGREPIPNAWTDYQTTDGFIEEIVPSDVRKESLDQEAITGIPDRTITAVLRGLVDNIGNNVIVIFDCCHSAGQWRAASIGETPIQPRCLGNLPKLHDNCDADIIGDKTKGLNRMRGGAFYSEPGQSSFHVLLAACRQDQYAGDTPSGGVFTRMLLDVLKPDQVRLLTYKSLVLKMKMPNQLQTPACFGPYQDRIIFTRTDGERTDDYFFGEFSDYWKSELKQDRVPIVYGGLVHGISKGDKFNIIDLSQRTRIGKVVQVFATCARLEIKSSRSATYFRSKIKPSVLETEQDPFYCRLICDYSKSPVYCSPKLLSKINTKHVIFSRASHKEKAVIIIADDEQNSSNVKLYFRPGCIKDENIFKDGIGNRFTESILKGNPTQIRDVLIAMSRFYSLLNTHNIPRGWGKIDIEFFRVKMGKSDGAEMKGTWTIDQKLAKDKDDAITIYAPKRSPIQDEEEGCYGMSITNNSAESLFAYVLRLEPGDMTICPWYSSSFHTPDIPFFQRDEDLPEVAAEIKPKETLPIGHGNTSDIGAAKFCVDHKLEADRTYFKIILTTSPADISMLIQTSNPLRPLGPDARATRASTARGEPRRRERGEVVQYARDQQRKIREDADYYSAIFTVNVCPKTDV